jgi:hypothetical protein
MTRKAGIAGLVVLLLLCGCAGMPPAQNDEGDVKAGPSSRPAWIDTPDAIFYNDIYLVGIGSGRDRSGAEQNAFATLSSIFRQSIEADQSIIALYQAAVKSGAVSGWTENTSVESAVKTSIAMDLVGAEIKDVWSGGGKFYAVAVMDKAKTALIYAQMIQDNLNIIDSLTVVPDSDMNSMTALPGSGLPLPLWRRTRCLPMCLSPSAPRFRRARYVPRITVWRLRRSKTTFPCR